MQWYKFLQHFFVLLSDSEHVMKEKGSIFEDTFSNIFFSFQKRGEMNGARSFATIIPA